MLAEKYFCIRQHRLTRNLLVHTESVLFCLVDHLQQGIVHLLLIEYDQVSNVPGHNS